MGTSKDYSGTRRGAWTAAKRVASQIATSGPSDELMRDYTRNYVEALGGATAAAQA